MGFNVMRSYLEDMSIWNPGTAHRLDHANSPKWAKLHCAQDATTTSLVT